MKTILIIDDHKDLSEMVQFILTRAGYRVILAYDSQHGIEKAKQELPDLILMDVMLPDLDGAASVKLLREDEKTKNIPVVFMTSLVSEQQSDDENMMFVGGQSFEALPKTLGKDEIVKRLKVYLGD
jgi:DNA-binding response OmpR family regulator